MLFRVGGGPGSSAVCFATVVSVVNDGEVGGGYVHRVPATDHGKEGTDKTRWDVGHTIRSWSDRGSGDKVSAYLNWPQAGEGS